MFDNFFCMQIHKILNVTTIEYLKNFECKNKKVQNFLHAIYYSIQYSLS